jgi:hypothetical protein
MVHHLPIETGDGMAEIGLCDESHFILHKRRRRDRDDMVVGFTTTCAISALHLFIVPYATFNNVSVISWQSVLLVEETRVPRENQRPVASH